MRIFQVLLLTLLSFGLSWGQESQWVYPPQSPDEETEKVLREAVRLTHLHRFEEAREMFLQVSAAHPGSSIGAETKISAANVAISGQKPDVGKALLQEVISDYSGSRFEVAARMALLQLNLYKMSTETNIQAHSELVTQLGGPSLRELLTGDDLSSYTFQVRQLHPETQVSLAGVYARLYHLVYNDNRSGEAARIALFGRQSFDRTPLSNNTFSSKLKQALRVKNKIPDARTQPSTPVISTVAPIPESTVGSEVELVALISTGTFQQASLDLSKLRVLIDNEDISESVELAIQVDFELDPSRNFETVTLRATRGLSPGRHTVTVRARSSATPFDPPNGPAEAELSWSFLVTTTPSPTKRMSQPSQDG